MITIKSINKNEVVNSEHVIKYSENLYAIESNGKTVAYATFTINNNIMLLDMIEVVEKGKGLGGIIVDFFFGYFSLDKIKGLILCEEGAYNFWKKMGAEIYYIDVEGYEIYELIDSRLESPFVLNR